VKLTNLNSATVAPNNLPALSTVVSGVVQETVLAGGNDDFASITDATYIGTDDGITKTGLQVFADEDFGTGQVMLPGVTTQAAQAAIDAHCRTFFRIGILDLPLGTDRDGAITARRLVGSSYTTMYWPWIQQNDFEGTGTKKFYPPSGAVAGVYARAEDEVGIHKAPANYVLDNVLDVEHASNGAQQVNQASRALLNANEVNVIAPFPGVGVKVYGARVLASFGRVTAVHQQRVLNRIYYDLKSAYQQFPFAPLDFEGKLFREVRSITEQYLSLLYRSGALTSVTGKEDDAYLVVCDASNNPPASLDLHQLNVSVHVHIVEMAEMVILDINNVPLSTNLSALNR
jgi:phage tail sheath protein FI